MGRKSAKGKEKKLRRKEENAKLAVSMQKVETANKLGDPLAPFPVFTKYERNGLSVKIECKKVTDLDEETIEWIFQLTRDNMKSLYESCEWGWKDREKKEELTEDKAWYLLARDQENKPVAFVHFRFDIECDDEVLYLYEIQLIKDVRKKGLGKFLTQIIELMANKYEMRKVMLTTFKHNLEGYNFFTSKLKYEVDETSPEDPVFYESYCYIILSKYTKLGKLLKDKEEKEEEYKMAANGSSGDVHRNGITT
ncbi:N-alpha-acetyltransferase 40-like [Haliotis rubra]|uniref:N-alpha-acetyltransferase 40-like n=1 Tax=Haliotis rubra TaxID=36100 RepID=UPI001EE626FE|nr:N-alpha-acetyltransferase 40-like [Haliotis rubra]